MKIQQAWRVTLTSTVCSLLIMPLPLYAETDDRAPSSFPANQSLPLSESNQGNQPINGASEQTQKPSISSSATVDPAKSEPPQPSAPNPYNQITVQSTPMPLPSPVVANDSILISSFKFSQGRGFDYIELFNTSTNAIEVSTLSLRMLYSDATTDYECRLQLDGYILGESYLSFAANPSGDILLLPTCSQSTSLLFSRELQVLRGETVVESVRILDSDMPMSVESRAWERRGWTSTYREGDLAGDFKLSTRPDIVYTSQLYAPPADPSLEIIEVLIQPQLCSPAELGLKCRSYVKLRNPTLADIDLSLFRLRSAQRDEAPSTFNTSSLAGVVPAGGFLVVSTSGDSRALALDKKEAAIWLEDKYGVISYPNQMIPYQKADSTSKRGLVWALDQSDNSWKWGLPNPDSIQTIFMSPGKGGVDNNQPDLVACRADQYRNPATNRCRLISTTGSELTACKAGQYRNPQTNRCRSSVSATSSSLTPCATNQFRNPETNRCKAIATTAGLKACAAGQERNPETNRCRKVASAEVPAAAFAPEIAKDGAKAFVAWWALGGVVAAGLGWAGWEYRFEIRRWVTQLLSRVKS